MLAKTPVPRNPSDDFYDCEGALPVVTDEAEIPEVNRLRLFTADGTERIPFSEAVDGDGKYEPSETSLPTTSSAPNSSLAGYTQASTSSSSTWMSQLSNVFGGRGSSESPTSGRSNVFGGRGSSDTPTSGSGTDSPKTAEGKAVRRYMFRNLGKIREITLSHAESVWYLKLDSDLIAEKAHSNYVLKAHSYSVEFEIPVDESFEPLMAVMKMDWRPLNASWDYTLRVGDTLLPECWSKGRGVRPGFEPPEIGRPRSNSNV